LAGPPPDFSDPLLDALQRCPPPVYAVLEGAHVENAGQALRAAGLVAHPLYLEGDDTPDVDSGPHLVDLPNLYALERVRALAGDKPALVFWSWQEGRESLYRHLRTINLVEIPKEGDTSAFETVVFRHASPNVMASVVPLLSADQLSRLMGAASGICMDAPDFGGVRLVPRPADLPARPRGYLRFSPEQIEALEKVELAKSRARVFRFLKETAPGDCGTLGDENLRDTVLLAEASGNGFGIRSEHGHFLWAYLYLTTGGDVADTPEVRKAFDMERSGDPDRLVEQIFDAHVDALDDPRLGA
jgi:hypothetical protein